MVSLGGNPRINAASYYDANGIMGVRVFNHCGDRSVIASRHSLHFPALNNRALIAAAPSVNGLLQFDLAVRAGIQALSVSPMDQFWSWVE